MAHKQREGTPPTRNTGPSRRGAPGWALACAALALAVAGMYLALYRIRGFRLPVGFDAPWYVWRAAFVAHHGVGPLGTATRPGSEVLGAVLGGMTGRSAFTVAVLLAPVLAGAFALALGALLCSTLGADPWRWLAAVVVGGTVLGATRLVDENVATLLFLCVVVAALVPLIEAAAGRPPWARGVVAATLLLVAAGLAHWLFLGVFALMMVLAIAILLPGSLRRRAGGVPLPRTESGTFAVAMFAAGATMAVTILGVLRAPANTIQVKEDPSRFVPKLTTDASRLRLWLLGPVAAFGAWALARGDGSHPRPRRRVMLLVVLCAWSAVAFAGVAFGVVTKRLPPHRFLELLVVVPGVAASAEVVAWLAARVRRRSGAVASRVAALAAVAAVVVLTIPGAVAWYGSDAPKPWIDPAALRSLAAVAAWSQTLPAGAPFVVLVSPYGPAGTESPALKERTVRAGLPADRQQQAHVFVGTLDDLLAGRRTMTPNPAMNAAIEPFWRDVAPVLASKPPIVIVHALAPTERNPHGPPGGPSGPGWWVERSGPPPGIASPTFDTAEPPDAFPGVVGAALWAGAFLALLWSAGLGWTWVMVGRDAPPPVAMGLAPAVGAAALIVAGTLASRLGVPLGRASVIVVYLVAVLAGFGFARVVGYGSHGTVGPEG